MLNLDFYFIFIMKLLRTRLLQKIKHDKSQETKSRIKNLSSEIKAHFTNEKKSKVRQGIKPGNNKTLWDAITSTLEN